MRQRWLDESRTSEANHVPEPEEAAPATGAENPFVAALAGAMAGTPAGEADAPAEGSAESAKESAGGSSIGANSSGSSESSPAAEKSGEDEAYLDRARSVAARRGQPEEAAASSSASASASSGSGSGSAATPAAGPAPIREEGGYQVPSPFLRAALSRLAAGGGS
jgi:hypothetical protein